MLSLDAVYDGAGLPSEGYGRSDWSSFFCALSDEDFAALQADPAALQAYYSAMLDAGVPYSGYPLMPGDMAVAGGIAPDASSPAVRTPTAVDKRRGPRSSSSKFRGVSCYKRCDAFAPGR